MAGIRYPLAVIALLAACSPPSAPVEEEPGLHAPTLLSPAEGSRIPQNDPTTGCYFDYDHGHGFQIAFDWSDVSAATSYHIYAIGSKGPFPNIYTKRAGPRFFSLNV